MISCSFIFSTCTSRWVATALLLLLTWWMERTRDVGGGGRSHPGGEWWRGGGWGSGQWESMRGTVQCITAYVMRLHSPPSELTEATSSSSRNITLLVWGRTGRGRRDLGGRGRRMGGEEGRGGGGEGEGRGEEGGDRMGLTCQMKGLVSELLTPHSTHT